MSRELKKYKLRATRKPMQSRYLASRVEVTDERGRDGYCYISFADEFIQAVGKRLPEGIALFSPARIEVAFDPVIKEWVVGASYQHGGLPTILWQSAQKPAWLNRIHYKEHHDTSQNRTQDGASVSGTPDATGSSHLSPLTPAGYRALYA